MKLVDATHSVAGVFENVVRELRAAGLDVSDEHVAAALAEMDGANESTLLPSTSTGEVCWQ